MFYKWFLLIVISFFIANCSNRKSEYVSKPARTAEDPNSDLLEVNTLVYHNSDTTSLVYFQINNENLLYRRPDTTKAFYSEMRVSCRLLDEASKKIIDSTTFYLADRSPNEHVQTKYIYAYTVLKCRTGADFPIEVDVLDIGRKTKYQNKIECKKQSRFNSQNFLVTKNDSVQFKNRFYKAEKLEVEYSNPGIKEIHVDCFSKEFGPALPPFSSREPDPFKYAPDSNFVIPIQDRTITLNIPNKGFYHLRSLTRLQEGLTLFCEDETFPGVSNSLEMINCTRYIMFKEEFEKCKDAPDKKAAIDEFWLNIGGSQERARELLKRYYGRVKETNKNYSSYTQGWKTDRGMIYIVMGPPANIYKTKKGEIWIYGSEINPNTLRFVFNKTENPFSDNDFVMERSPFYKDSYHTAVEYWRQGLIYFDGRR